MPVRGHVAIVALAVSAAPVARTQEMPRFDVEALCHNADPCLSYNKDTPECRRIPPDQMQYRRRQEKACLVVEQSAYDYVKGPWDDMAPQAKRTCLRNGHLGVRPYYTMSVCVSQVMSEVDRNRALDGHDGHFRY